MKRDRADEAEAQLPPCDGMCTPMSGPEEDCSRHGRPPAELWAIIVELQTRAIAAESRITELEEELLSCRRGQPRMPPPRPAATPASTGSRGNDA